MKKRLLKTNKKNLFEGPYILTPNLMRDDRGYFFESWNKSLFDNLISQNINFVQNNNSLSKLGTLRGMHYQTKPSAQAKLIKVLQGSIYDVIIDLRYSSETFSEWGFVYLDNVKNEQLWVPEGFAHGFLTLSDTAIVEYSVTDYWNRDNERTLIWNDSQIEIKWPFSDNNKIPIISEKDKSGFTLNQIINNQDIF